MIAVITISVASVFAAVAFLVTKRWIEKPTAHQAPWVLFFMAITIAGAMVTFNQSHEIESALKARGWTTTEATVISSKVVGKRAFHPEIVYSYQVGTIVYTDTTDMEVPGFGTKANRLLVAENNVEANHEGQKFIVHYDPSQPSRVVIRIFPTYTVFLLLAVAVCGFTIGLYGILIRLLHK